MVESIPSNFSESCLIWRQVFVEVIRSKEVIRVGPNA